MKISRSNQEKRGKQKSRSAAGASDCSIFSQEKRVPDFRNPHRPFPEAAVQCIFFRRQWTPRGARPCPYRRISRAAGSAAAAGRTHGTKESWKWGGATVAKYCRLHGGKSTGRYKGVSTNLVPTIFCYQREKTKAGRWCVVLRLRHQMRSPSLLPFFRNLLVFPSRAGGRGPGQKREISRGLIILTKSGCRALLLAGGRRIYF